METVQVGKPDPEVTVEILTETLGTIILAPVIIDLTNIYDDDSDDINTSAVPIINEANA
jgi:hypothetical protein